MHIDSYSFGTITIDNKKYTSDIIIYSEKVNPHWWREDGHYLHLNDLEDVIASQPDIIVIGTGKLGLMKVPDNVKNYLEDQGYEV